ncbi:hypothetical protein F4779DRAFT_602046 [Xylariaceae sp. FL0662B]|nr:hypothetical protein F4779DRAFT_602046 [Xylariaceae sp. FL0662B]
MNNAYGSPDSYKEAAPTAAPYNAGLELAHNQPPPPKWDEPEASQPSAPPPQERTICGLRRTTFFLLVALIIVIIAAAVGGGVGGSLAVQNAKDSAASCVSASASGGNTVVSTVTATIAAEATGTSTATAGLTVPTGVLKTDCPDLDSNQVVTLGGKSWTFAATCGTDYVGADFGAAIVYSFRDCLQACAAHNHFSGADACLAIAFNANQTSEIPTHYGNCWLKNGTGKIVSGKSNTKIAAQLKSTS